MDQSLDSCIYYTQLAADQFLIAEDWNWHAIMLGAIGNVYYIKGWDEEARDYYERSLDVVREHLSNIPYSILNGYAIIFHKSRGRYDEAINLFFEALTLGENNGATAKQRSNLLENIGHSFTQKGDLVKGEQYLQEALELKRQSIGRSEITAIRNANKLAVCYRQSGQPNRAIDLLQENVRYLDDIQIYSTYPDNRRIEAFTQLADLYLERGQRDSCQIFIDKALSLQISDQSLEKSFTYRILGELAASNDDLPLAITHFQEALRLSLVEHAVFPFHADIAEMYRHLGNTYGQLGDHQQALNHYHRGLLALCPELKDLPTTENPETAAFVDSNAGLEILWAKATYLRQYSKKQSNNILAQDALDAYQRAIATIREVRKGYGSEKAKLLLGGKVAQLFEEALQHCWQMYQDTETDVLLPTLYTLIEGNRANLLLESLQGSSAQAAGILPDSLIEQEYFLDREIIYYKRKIQEGGLSNEVPANTLQRWKIRLTELQQQYDVLQRRIAQQYPSYYELKYAYQQVEVAQLKDRLPDDQTAFVQYFIGRESSFVAFVTRREIQVFALSCTTSSLQEIEQLRKMLASAPNSKRFLTDRQQYAEIGTNLYQLLLAPLSSSAYKEIEKLVVVPDGQLHSLPFELLLWDKPTDVIDFSLETFSYLLEKYAISYAYSGTLFYHNTGSPDKDFNKLWAGFAPSFGEADQTATRTCFQSELSSLRCNQQEVRAIRELISTGDMFLGHQADKRTFEDLISNYRIVHLATHACVDKATDAQNQIFFADDYVAANELNYYQLNAELAVLSACNTGSGELVIGEGVLSLARNFAVAGVSSTLMSLWSVDDCNTAAVMEAFYRHLVAGKSKSEALQLAKLDLLKSGDKLSQHPYYWAAFLQYGKPDSMKSLRAGFSNWTVALAVLLMLGLCYIFLAQRKT
ncbi:MAG: CHAT domain-containing protein [Bacteroidota bacterium]